LLAFLVYYVRNPKDATEAKRCLLTKCAEIPIQNLKVWVGMDSAAKHLQDISEEWKQLEEKNGVKVNETTALGWAKLRSSRKKRPFHTSI